MSAFVAGATGYTGRELVAALARAGRDPVAHVRPDSTRKGEWRERFEALGARVDETPWEEAAMTRTLEALRPELVFALLGTTRARGRSTGDTYESVDYALSALLLRAATHCESRPRFVYLSAVGVTPDTTNPYLAVRARLEREIAESGLPYTIARPAFITGPDRDDRRTAERAFAATLDGALNVARVLGARRFAEKYRSTSNTALAHALVRVALDPDFENCVVEGADLR